MAPHPAHRSIGDPLADFEGPSKQLAVFLPSKSLYTARNRSERACNAVDFLMCPLMPAVGIKPGYRHRVPKVRLSGITRKPGCFMSSQRRIPMV